MALDLPGLVARELSLPRDGVARALALFAEGATIPFVARYRKEQTGSLDEVALQSIRDRAAYLDELEARRQTILATIADSGKLTDELAARIGAVRSKTELEDLYLPFKPKRRTRASIARARGLEPLADEIWAQRRAAPPSIASFIGGEVPDEAAAWQGARDIVAERIAEDAGVRKVVREHTLARGVVFARVVKGKEAKKFEDYLQHREPVRTIPSHRTLALRRAETEGALRVGIDVDRAVALAAILSRIVREPRAALAAELRAAAEDAYDRLLAPSIEADVHNELRERADRDAIRIFGENLRHLLLAPPLGRKRVLAVDPGFRTGCKVAALDETGGLLADAVVYPHEPQRREAEARATLAALCATHKIEAIAVGNGTAGRETHELLLAMRVAGELPAGCLVALVNESGASVYSASEIAREELPDKDVTLRGAVSIGRRLIDPLAELVKIDARSIGVGQYQHDVSQPALARALDAVVESCVNRVGVEVNTASARLLAYVSGIGDTLARNIVAHRAANGPFRSRRQLLDVPRLGAKAFEQAAGFLRVRDARNPLDASAVHPESYDVVERMARDLRADVAALVGNTELLGRIDLGRYADERRGEPTLRDILAELAKPGRDPRDPYEETGFRADVTAFEHLVEGMVLRGMVTNVTAFGAFVDVGVHQDGLVHVSELANSFVVDPAEVVKAGDRVNVKVIKIDRERRRIGLSMKQVK